MSILDSIKTFLNKKESNQTVEAPEGFCPNCWGRQEYGGQFYEAMKNEGISISNIDQKQGWIQDYVNKNLNGIVLKGEKQTCSVCYASYDHKH